MGVTMDTRVAALHGTSDDDVEVVREETAVDKEAAARKAVVVLDEEGWSRPGPRSLKRPAAAKKGAKVLADAQPHLPAGAFDQAVRACILASERRVRAPESGAQMIAEGITDEAKGGESEGEYSADKKRGKAEKKGGGNDEPTEGLKKLKIKEKGGELTKGEAGVVKGKGDPKVEKELEKSEKEVEEWESWVPTRGGSIH